MTDLGLKRFSFPHSAISRQHDQHTGFLKIGRCKTLESSENLCGVLLNLYLLRTDDAGYHAVLVSNECGAEDTHSHPATHFLLSIDTQLGNKRLLSVAYQRERESVFFNELLVTLGILRAHANHGITQREETLIIVTQIASLVSAAGSRVARINIEYDFLACKFSKSPFFTVLVDAKDFGEFLSCFHISVLFDFMNMFLTPYSGTGTRKCIAKIYRIFESQTLYNKKNRLRHCCHSLFLFCLQTVRPNAVRLILNDL